MTVNTTSFELSDKKRQEIQVRRAVQDATRELSSAFQEGLAIAADEAARLAMAGHVGKDAQRASVRLGLATAIAHNVCRGPSGYELELFASIFLRLGYDSRALREDLIDAVAYVLRACGAGVEAAKLTTVDIEKEDEQ